MLSSRYMQPKDAWQYIFFKLNSEFIFENLTHILKKYLWTGNPNLKKIWIIVPFSNALVWHDARTKAIVDEIVKNSGEKGLNIIRDDCGLPVSTYFSASKVFVLHLPINLNKIANTSYLTGLYIVFTLKLVSGQNFCSYMWIRSSKYGKKNSDFPPFEEMVILVNEFVIFLKTVRKWIRRKWPPHGGISKYFFKTTFHHHF